MIGSPIPKDYIRIMKDYLPKYYADSYEVMSLIESEAMEVESVQNNIEDSLHQLFPQTATWGLDTWEQICGVVTDPTKPIDQRRDTIIAKLRGTGTVTLSMMNNVADAFYETNITEFPALYQVEFKIVGIKGVPSNFNEYKKAIEELIPAHLQPLFAFRYTIWSELKPLKWKDLKQYTWKTLKVTMF